MIREFLLIVKDHSIAFMDSTISIFLNFLYMIILTMKENVNVATADNTKLVADMVLPNIRSVFSAIDITK